MIFPTISSICDQFVAYIDKNRENVNAAKLCAKYTLEVMASCGLGIQGQTLTDEESQFLLMTENMYSQGNLLKTTATLFLPALGKILKMPFV